MAPLPSNERVKALALLNGRVVAWVVGTGPSGAGEPWVEQWFFFEDKTASGTYGDYPGILPEMLFGARQHLADADGRQGYADSKHRPGRRRNQHRRTLRKLRLGTGVTERAVDPVVQWYTYDPSENDIGVYHAAGGPANDDPEEFFDHGLKDLLDEFGRADLEGPVGYVYGEAWRKTNKVLDTTAAMNVFIEPLCAETVGTVSPQVVKLYRGATVVGYAYSSHKQSDYQGWSHRRGVHQFLVHDVQMHLPGEQTEMVNVPVPNPIPAHLNSAKDFAAWLAGASEQDWPRSTGTTPKPCDYYYGCAYVTLDCDPDQNDRPQTPAQYPGS